MPNIPKNSRTQRYGMTAAEYNSRNGVLTAKQRHFVAAYIACKDKKQAAIEAGVPEGSAYSMATQWLNPDYHPLVVQAIERLQARVDATSVMKADDVRRYISTVMQICIPDYFTPDNHGGWMISEEDYRNLPREVRCLIEECHMSSLTIEDAQGNKTEKHMLAVRIVSKTKALDLAAKYTLTEHHSVNQVLTVDFDEMAKPRPVGAEAKAIDPVEEKIKALEMINPNEVKVEDTRR